jgi:hypothetical protein
LGRSSGIALSFSIIEASVRAAAGDASGNPCARLAQASASILSIARRIRATISARPSDSEKL